MIDLLIIKRETLGNVRNKREVSEYDLFEARFGI